ncbi:hypothetical protein [Priestia megaterium]|uniref:hypothetical protein n=1 Tax=Priestia megaterium TaxID=1404 RepID=UPI00300ACE4F
MISEKDSLVLFKFSEHRWINSIQEGNISFACPGRYIEIAKKTGNNEQGDIDEGVFARLKKGDPRISECTEKLKDDLEIIDENNGYVKLRRKSSYFIPTFCFYSYRGMDLLSDREEEYGEQYVSHFFDNKMFDGFSNYKFRNVLSNNFYPASLFIKSKPFIIQLKQELSRLGIRSETRHINYTEFENDEFFITPDEKRSELFYKFPKYKYQKEARVCLHDNPLEKIDDRFNINIGSLTHSKLFTKEVYFKVKARIEK